MHAETQNDPLLTVLLCLPARHYFVKIDAFFPEKILKSKVTLDLIEHGIGASDSPKNT